MFKQERYENPAKQEIIHRHEAQAGFADLLGYLFMLDGSTVLHKDGGLSRHFRYIAPDLDSSTDAGLDLIAEKWQKAFRFLGDGWMVENNLCSFPYRHKAPTQGFPDPVSALIDDERRLQFADDDYFQNTYYLSISWKPSDRLAGWIERKLHQFIISDPKVRESLSRDVATFNHGVTEFIGYLSAACHIQPLKDDELCTFLYQCISGEENKLCAPHMGHMLDSYLSRNDFAGGFHPKIGNKFLSVLALDDLPATSFPCLLDSLSYLPISYRWSSRFLCLDGQTTQKYLKSYQRNWSTKAVGVLGTLQQAMGMHPKKDRDAQETADKLEAEKNNAKSGNFNYGFYNSNIILMHEDKAVLEEITKAVKNEVQRLDFIVRRENVNSIDAYLGSLPAHGGYNLRKIMVETNYLSHALPTSSVFQGESICPCNLYGENQPPLMLTATRGSRPFALNLHHQDVGHTLICGPTGSGKSTLLHAIMASHRRYKNSRVIVFDKDASNESAVKMLGGQYTKAEDLTNAFTTPLIYLDPNNDKTITDAIDWVTQIFLVQGIKPSPSQQILLSDAVRRLAHEANPNYRNLQHLTLQDETLRNAKRAFETSGYGKLLSGTKSLFQGNSVFGIEMKDILGDSKTVNDFAIPVMLSLFHAIERVVSLDRALTVLILEEGWLYLGHHLFRDKIKDWLLTLRKFNVSVLFTTQEVSGIVNSDVSGAMQTSFHTRIYLSNPSIIEEGIREHYIKFGLNETQLALIHEMQPKRDYYYVGRLGNRMFNLELGALSRAFLCLSPDDEKHFGSLDISRKEWVGEWLNYKNLPDWKRYAENNYLREEAAHV